MLAGATTLTLFPSPVVAQDPSATSTNSLTVEKQTRVINLAADISNRIDAHISRLDDIHDRLDSRIRKLSSAFTPDQFAVIDQYMTLADSSLTAARQRLAPINPMVFAVVSAPDPAAELTPVATLYEESTILVNTTTAVLTELVEVIRLYQTNADVEVEQLVEARFSAAVLPGATVAPTSTATTTKEIDSDRATTTSATTSTPSETDPTI